MKTVALCLCASAAVAACAPPPAAPDPGSSLAQAQAQAPAPAPRQCFFAGNVNSYREAGPEAVNLRVGASQVWRLELFGNCPDIRWSFGRIALQQRGGGSSICGGMQVDVLTNDAGRVRRCPVRTVRRLSEGEVAALPSDQRP